jgi:hypothetical protein
VKPEPAILIEPAILVAALILSSLYGVEGVWVKIATVVVLVAGCKIDLRFDSKIGKCPPDITGLRPGLMAVS